MYITDKIRLEKNIYMGDDDVYISDFT